MEKISNEEMEGLRKYCVKSDETEKMALLDICMAVKYEIAVELFYSLVKQQSYEALSRCEYIPMSRMPFYKYQRKVLIAFRQVLIECGLWNAE